MSVELKYANEPASRGKNESGTRGKEDSAKQDNGCRKSVTGKM